MAFNLTGFSLKIPYDVPKFPLGVNVDEDNRLREESTFAFTLNLISLLSPGARVISFSGLVMEKGNGIEVST